MSRWGQRWGLDWATRQEVGSIRPVGNTVHVGGRFVAKTKVRYALRGVKFKSRYEYNAAVLYDYLGVAWEYEPVTFRFPIQRGTVSYRPDFRLTATGEFVECKGYWDRRSKVQQKRMKIHHPSVRILVLDTPFFRDLCAKRVCKLVPGYVCRHTAP